MHPEKLHLLRERMLVRSIARRLYRETSDRDCLDVARNDDALDELHARLTILAAKDSRAGEVLDFFRWLVENAWDNRNEILRIIKEIVAWFS